MGHNGASVDSNKLARLKTEIAANIASNKKTNENKYADYTSTHYYKNSEKDVLEFDPNVDDFKLLLKKGIPYKTVQNIVNFRAKGGQFRSVADLKKLYSVTDEIYGDIAPHAIFAGAKSSTKENKKAYSQFKEVQVAINSATVEELETLRGIGPTYAKRIVKFRQSLGGFHNVQQLYEVWGLDSATVGKLVPKLVVDKASITLIKINSATVAELASHPYLSYKEANAIVNYRVQHGSFSEITSLQKLHVFAGKDISRLFPYLDLN